MDYWVMGRVLLQFFCGRTERERERRGLSPSTGGLVLTRRKIINTVITSLLLQDTDKGERVHYCNAALFS